MPSLNRFPLLGLWAREAAHRIGYNDEDADTLGHAYAVLYAIRSNSTARPVTYKDPAAAASVAAVKAQKPDIEHMDFGGDSLQVSHDPQGRLIGRVGNDLPQTSATYRYKVAGKYPAGWYDKLAEGFRSVFAKMDPKQLDGKLLYQLYDGWKKTCAAGRMVDLDKLLAWCQKQAVKP